MPLTPLKESGKKSIGLYPHPADTFEKCGRSGISEMDAGNNIIRKEIQYANTR